MLSYDQESFGRMAMFWGVGIGRTSEMIVRTSIAYWAGISLVDLNIQPISIGVSSETDEEEAYSPGV